MQGVEHVHAVPGQTRQGRALERAAQRHEVAIGEGRSVLGFGSSSHDLSEATSRLIANRRKMKAMKKVARKENKLVHEVSGQALGRVQKIGLVTRPNSCARSDTKQKPAKRRVLSKRSFNEAAGGQSLEGEQFAQLEESCLKLSASKRAKIDHQQQNGGVLTKLFESPLCFIRRGFS